MKKNIMIIFKTKDLINFINNLEKLEKINSKLFKFKFVNIKFSNVSKVLLSAWNDNIYFSKRIDQIESFDSNFAKNSKENNSMIEFEEFKNKIDESKEFVAFIRSEKEYESISPLEIKYGAPNLKQKVKYGELNFIFSKEELKKVEEENKSQTNILITSSKEFEITNKSVSELQKIIKNKNKVGRLITFKTKNLKNLNDVLKISKYQKFLGIITDKKVKIINYQGDEQIIVQLEIEKIININTFNQGKILEQIIKKFEENKKDITFIYQGISYIAEVEAKKQIIANSYNRVKFLVEIFENKGTEKNPQKSSTTISDKQKVKLIKGYSYFELKNNKLYFDFKSDNDIIENRLIEPLEKMIKQSIKDFIN